MTVAQRMTIDQSGENSARIVDEINRLDETDLDRFGAWRPLAELSSRTAFEAVDADPASVTVDQKGRFEAIASIYVTLAFGPSNDEETMSDEYTATIHGTISGKVEIEQIEVDTSSFYE